MKIEKVENDKIFINIPLTQPTGKIRTKTRDIFYEYGIPVATRKKPFTQKHYIEWQIGYDILKEEQEKLELTTLKNLDFIAYNEKKKVLYELSEYAFYFAKNKIIEKTEMQNLLKELAILQEKDMVDSNFLIERSHPQPNVFNGMTFCTSAVKYPLLVYRFGSFDILIEINVKEKQTAIGVQPMLYVCFPITELISDNPLLGRTAEEKESATLIIDYRHKDFIFNSLKIFGMLSKAHNYDIRQIVELIIKNAY